MALPRVSVVVPTLNEATTLPETLAPLQPLRASGQAEVVVSDGGSVDGTPSVAAALADHVVIGSPGRAEQMNRGAGAARGELLLFLHADTLVPDGWIEDIASATAGGAGWGRFDVVIAGRPLVLPLIAGMMNLRSRLSGIATGDQGIFVRRELFARCGGYPPIPLMEDVALSRALKRAAGHPACLRSRLRTSGRRWERHGPLRTVLLMWRLRLLYFFGADPAQLARSYPR